MRYFAVMAASLLPVAAVAQDQLCEGVDPGSWVGGSREGSNLTVSDSHFEISSIAPAAGSIVSLFEVTEPTDVRLEAWGSFGADPAAELYTESGELILMNDDGGENFGVYVEETLQPGAYCMRTYSFDQSVLAASVRIGRTEHEAATSAAAEAVADAAGSYGSGNPYDACETPEPLNLAVGMPATGQATIGDVPKGYSITLTEPTPLVVSANSVDGDTLLTMFNANGSEIATNDDYDGLNSKLEMFSPLDPGEYCVVLQNYNGTAAAMTIEAQILDAATVRKMQIDNAEMAPLPDDDVTVSDLGPLTTSALRDVQISGVASWHKFTVTGESLVLIEAGAVGESDPMLDLFDNLGRHIEHNDDASGEDYGAQIVAKLFPGEYLVAVRNNDSERSFSTRLILERFVRAAE